MNAESARYVSKKVFPKIRRKRAGRLRIHSRHPQRARLKYLICKRWTYFPRPLHGHKNRLKSIEAIGTLVDRVLKISLGWVNNNTIGEKIGILTGGGDCRVLERVSAVL
jgi:hypothetical protein